MSKLKKILIKARKQVFSEMVGNNASIFQGEGYDFIELREYMPGDDIRHIDWNITAKMQKPYIKVFREERELNVVLVSLMSGSLYFGSKVFKQDYLAEVVANISFSVLKNGDLLSSYMLSDRALKHHKPSKQMAQVQKIVGDVLNFDPLNEKLDWDFIQSYLLERIKRRSLIIFMGDFFELPKLKILAKKHEVIALIIRDKYEEFPPEIGFASLVDPQTGAWLEGDFDKEAVQNYYKEIVAYDRELYQNLRQSQVRFDKLYTDKNPSVGLRKVFEGA